MTPNRQRLEHMPLEDLLRYARSIGIAEDLLDAVRKGKRRVQELVNLIVHEVSLVDRGANRRVFLLRKQESLVSTRVQKNGDGTFVPTQAPAQAPSPDATPRIAVVDVFKSIFGTTMQLVEKALVVSPMVRRVAFNKAMEAEDCINRAMTTIMVSADSGTAQPGDLERILAEEFRRAGSLLLEVAAACEGQEPVRQEEVVEKAGRRISKHNLERMQGLRKAVGAAHAQLDEAAKSFDGFLTDLSGTAEDGEDVEDEAVTKDTKAKDAAGEPASVVITTETHEHDPDVLLNRIAKMEANQERVLGLLERGMTPAQKSMPAPSALPDDDDDDVPALVNDGTQWPVAISLNDKNRQQPQGQG